MNTLARQPYTGTALPITLRVQLSFFWSVVPAGSMTIHHCCTLHASYPNRSTNPRRGLVYQISAGDSIQLGGNLHKVWGTWLKGSDPLHARLIDGTTYRLTAPLTNKGGLEPTGDWRRETQD